MFHWYGLMVGIAIVVGWSVAEKINPIINKIWVYIMLGSLVGARAYHVIDLHEYYLLNPIEILSVWNGGLAIWGGVSGCVAAILIYHYRSRTLNQIWKTFSAVAIASPLGQAIGRIGNGFNQEFEERVLGLPWWGVEAMADLGLFYLIWRVYKRGDKDKIVVSIYLIGYGVIRFVLEFWRINSWEIGGLGVAQWSALTSVVIGLLLWRLSAQD